MVAAVTDKEVAEAAQIVLDAIFPGVGL